MNRNRKASVGVGTPKEAMFESENGEFTSTYQYITINDSYATTRFGGEV